VNCFEVPHKIGMINLWRKRCTKLKEFGVEVKPEDCAQCDRIAAEIAANVKASAEEEGFGKGRAS
jgi:hypothetical protein